MTNNVTDGGNREESLFYFHATDSTFPKVNEMSSNRFKTMKKCLSVIRRSRLILSCCRFCGRVVNSFNIFP